MLRRSGARLTDVRHTSVPSFFSHPIEMAFYFPRFHPRTHINASGIPELMEAVDLMTRHSAVPRPVKAPSGHRGGEEQKAVPLPRWTTTVSSSAKPTTDASVAAAVTDASKSLFLLERGIDIFDSVGGVGSASVANLLRPLFAARFEMLNGSEHAPRSDYARHLHVQKAILRQAGTLLYHNDVWDKSDVQQIDTTCVILSHFVKAFCAVHPRPFHQAQAMKSVDGGGNSTSATAGASSTVGKTAGLKMKSSGGSAKSGTTAPASPPGLFDAANWKLQVGITPGEVLTLPMVMDRVNELLRLTKAVDTKYRSTHPEVRWLKPKLLLLKALLTIPLTGHLLHAQAHIDDATKYVMELNARSSVMLDSLKGRVDEPELGLYLLLKAEMGARVLDWDLPPGQVEVPLLHLFQDALTFYSEPYVTGTDADGIMSVEKLPERRFEAEAHACVLRSFADFMLAAPRPKATSTRDVPVFLPRQLFSMNPLLSVATSSPYIFSDPQRTDELSLETCRRRTGDALDKALKLNRMLFPEFKQNAPAAATLLSMACMYADTRDYLYATGLFETAKKATVQVHGDSSVEHVLMEKLRYEFLAGVGSEQEAKTASHEVVHLLKSVDALPS